MKRLGGVLITITVAALVGISTLPAGAVTKAQLRSKLLSISDLPTAWTVDNSSSSGVVSGGCLAGVAHTPKSETKVEAEFKNGSLPVLKEELVSGHGMATAAYDRLNGVLTRCKHFTATSNGQTYDYSTGAMSFPAIGDRSTSYDVSFSVEGINGGIELVLFELGSIAGLVGYGYLGQPDPNQLQGFVNEAVNKIEGKPTTPPTSV
jgi:hypothetical protein